MCQRLYPAYAYFTSVQKDHSYFSVLLSKVRWKDRDSLISGYPSFRTDGLQENLGQPQIPIIILCSGKFSLDGSLGLRSFAGIGSFDNLGTRGVSSLRCGDTAKKLDPALISNLLLWLHPNFAPDI